MGDERTSSLGLWRRFLDGLVSPAGARRLLGWSADGARPGARVDLGAARRIGVVRLDGMGDLVVTTPFLRELRRSVPGARIELVVRREWAGLVRHCPHVDEVIPFDRPWPLRYRRQRELWHAWRWTRREIRPRGWDLVLLPQCHFAFFEARWVAWLSGAGIRAGRRDAAEPEGDEAWGFLDDVRVSPASGHDAVGCLEWLEALGGKVEDRSLELHLGAEARAEAGRWVGELPSGRPVVALGLGASQVEKVWPVERFEEVARRLIRAGAVPVLIGGEDCVEPARRLLACFGGAVHDWTGRLELDVTAAVLGRCMLFVGNDSGPMHLAAAAGIPVVEIVGWAADVPESVVGTPKRIGPWCRWRRVLQPATGGAAARVRVDRVEAAAVWEGVVDLVRESSGGRIDWRGV